MTHQGFHVTVSELESGTEVCYYAFAVLSIFDDMSSLEDALLRLSHTDDPAGESHLDIKRFLFEDKVVCAFLLRLDNNCVIEARKASRLAWSIATSKNYLMLPIEKVCDKYPELYWQIVNRIPESEGNNISEREEA